MLHISMYLCKKISCTASSKPNHLLVKQIFKILSAHRRQKDLHAVSCESNSICSQQGDKPSWWGLRFFLFKAGLLIKEDLGLAPCCHKPIQGTAGWAVPWTCSIPFAGTKREEAICASIPRAGQLPQHSSAGQGFGPKLGRGRFPAESAGQVQCPRSRLWPNTSPLAGSLRARPANLQQSDFTTFPTVSVLVPLSIPLGHPWLAPAFSPGPLFQMTLVAAPWIPRQRANHTEGSAHQVPCCVLYSDSGKPLAHSRSLAFPSLCNRELQFIFKLHGLQSPCWKMGSWSLSLCNWMASAPQITQSPKALMGQVSPLPSLPAFGSVDQCQVCVGKGTIQPKGRAIQDSEDQCGF